MLREPKEPKGFLCSGCHRVISWELQNDTARCDFTDQYVCDECTCHVLNDALDHLQVIVAEQSKSTCRTSGAFGLFLREKLGEQSETLKQIAATVIEQAVEEFNREFEKEGVY